MTAYEIAKSYIGVTEGPGPENNPTILEMYARVGHSWVEHDDVAWCAAFVGSCLEQAGEKSTRSLAARSYLDWGVPVPLDEAREGDIVVFKRGRSAWQGHVAFFLRDLGESLEVLGGNQGNAVSVARYAKAGLLGIRRAGQVAPSVGLSVAQVQARLRDLGYFEVGAVDGILGKRTAAAILAFRSDNDLPLVPVMDGTLMEALVTASPREVSEARAKGMPKHSRIMAAAQAQIGLGTVGVVGTVVGQIAPALIEAENAQSLLARAARLIGLDAAFVELALPWIGALCFVGIILYALKARRARIADHRSGKTA